MESIENEEEQLSRKQKFAILYKRRESYRQAFRDLGLMPLWEEVRKYEKQMNLTFDTNAFYYEVRHPNRCVNIDFLIRNN